MKVQGVEANSIQSQNFEGKQRFLSKAQMEDVKTLLTRMNSETECEIGDYHFKSKIVKSLIYKDKADFTDGRGLFEKVAPQKQMKKETLFTVGKTELVIDNITGEIKDYYKPFFTCWKNVFKNIDKYLKIFVENYNNPNIVTKKTLSMDGFTQAGFELLQKIKKIGK